MTQYLTLTLSEHPQRFQLICSGQQLNRKAIQGFKEVKIMKKVIYLILALLLYSCTNPVEKNEELKNEDLKYSENDLKLLSDSARHLYLQDAAFIEFGTVTKDTNKRINQVILDEDKILSHYEDLVFIYNNSFTLSNSFFEYASSQHSYGAECLFRIRVSVDTNKSWASNWKNGIKYTGIAAIDTLIDNYNLKTNIIGKYNNKYGYEIKSDKPINFFALVHKFKMTSEFIYVEPTVFVGGGSSISLKVDGSYKYYIYYFGWGDCPAGCINYHYWIVRLRDKELSLVEEGGNPLN